MVMIKSTIARELLVDPLKIVLQIRSEERWEGGRGRYHFEREARKKVQKVKCPLLGRVLQRANA